MVNIGFVVNAIVFAFPANLHDDPRHIQQMRQMGWRG